MKKARLFGLALVGAAALLVGCANDEASTCKDGASCSAEKAECCSADKAAGATGEKTGCSDKAAGATGCCKDKAAEAKN